MSIIKKMHVEGIAPVSNLEEGDIVVVLWKHDNTTSTHHSSIRFEGREQHRRHCPSYLWMSSEERCEAGFAPVLLFRR